MLYDLVAGIIEEKTGDTDSPRLSSFERIRYTILILDREASGVKLNRVIRRLICILADRAK
jgi:hypothetical protein